MSFRVLKFGWEYPPFYLGGLGMACEGLVHGLLDKGMHISLILPYPYKNDHKVQHEKLTVCSINALQISSEKDSYWYLDKAFQKKARRLYSDNLFKEVKRYAQGAKKIIQNNTFDIIHAHEWMTFEAAMLTKKITHKPLIAHVHATEYDRSGGTNLHKKVFDIEKKCFQNADTIIAVSNFTKDIIVKQYNINPAKIAVVYNALPLAMKPKTKKDNHQNKKPKVLFLGRLTKQKGGQYFIDAAKKVLQTLPDVEFCITGSGDMQEKLEQKVQALGLENQVTFEGFVRGQEVIDMYCSSDIFVMPSVSEPFGLVALEAISYGLPLIVSKQSGVSEVIHHCYKTDYWDIDYIAECILNLINDKDLSEKMAMHAKKDIAQLTWQNAAQECIEIYKDLCLCNVH